MTCEFCGACGFISHREREMMHGFRDEFEYLECDSCGLVASAQDYLVKEYDTECIVRRSLSTTSLGV